MKTDDLIRALAADARPQGPSLRGGVALAVAGGAVAAALALLATLGLRPDLATALGSIRFLFKFAVTASLAGVALHLALVLARPGTARGGAELALLLPMALLVAAVGLELLAVPEASWQTRMVGSNWAVCLLAVPSFSLVPLALLLLALRRGAAESAPLAGLVAGLAAGGIGAFFYAAHCPDDSPLFVAVWYTLAIGAVGALGAILGARLLRW